MRLALCFAALITVLLNFGHAYPLPPCICPEDKEAILQAFHTNTGDKFTYAKRNLAAMAGKSRPIVNREWTISCHTDILKHAEKTGQSHTADKIYDVDLGLRTAWQEGRHGDDSENVDKETLLDIYLFGGGL